jgi:methylated-DNA-[protein]-cysteine S-methyltransferase
MSTAPAVPGTDVVSWGSLDSAWGRLVVAATPRGLVRVSLVPDEEEAVLASLAARSGAPVEEAPERVDVPRRQIDEYLGGRRRVFELDVDWWSVGPFGREVLAGCAGIGFGEVATYRDLAVRVGRPGAARAVGNALGANPVPIVVPCHRVLRSGGGLGGYTGGLHVKEHLLRLEGVLA